MTTSAIPSKGPQAVSWDETSQKAAAWGKETHKNKPKQVTGLRRRGTPHPTQQRPQDGACATVGCEKPSTINLGTQKEPERLSTAPEKGHCGGLF